MTTLPPNRPTATRAGAEEIALKIVSLFSGLGGLDIACERAFGGKTIVQVEREPFAVRLLARRWPDARQHDDVMTYRGEPCDVVCGGFPCTDLSVAGKREGLDAARSGLYHEMMRIVGEAKPRFAVVENVPPLLAYRGRVDTYFAQLGYGTIWQVCEASDVGAPHRRQRVFVLAVLGLAGSQMLPRPSPQGDLFAPVFGGDKVDGVMWGTPRAVMSTPSQDRRKGNLEDHVFAAELRATPTATQPGYNFDAHLRRKVAVGMVNPKVTDLGMQVVMGAARWPTPTICGNDNRKGASATSGDGLATAAKAWPTPAARDWKDSGHEPAAQVRNSPCLPASAVMADGQAPGVLNPAWVDLLMGLPAGWTDLDATPDLDAHRWPAGRGEDQHPSEPPRLVAPKSTANRGARLKALGNAVVWQQAEAAIRRALAVAGIEMKGSYVPQACANLAAAPDRLAVIPGAARTEWALGVSDDR